MLDDHIQLRLPKSEARLQRRCSCKNKVQTILSPMHALKWNLLDIDQDYLLSKPKRVIKFTPNKLSYIRNSKLRLTPSRTTQQNQSHASYITAVKYILTIVIMRYKNCRLHYPSYLMVQPLNPIHTYRMPRLKFSRYHRQIIN